MARVFLGMGSNLGDRQKHLELAIDRVGKLATTRCLQVSKIMENPPLSGGPEQGYFLNLVAEVETELQPTQLLHSIQEIEKVGGRQRSVAWGPRTIDIDILLYEQVVLAERELTIPHPEMLKRDFVMVPLLEIAPDAKDPQTGLFLRDIWSKACGKTSRNGSRMKLIKTVEEMRKAVKEIQKAGRTIGFVPTMGNLHQGHLSLVKESKKETDITIVSIFVNPTQFGPNEDFKKYPRTLEQDTQMLDPLGVDIVFAPNETEMYTQPTNTLVMVGGGLTNNLEGCTRPGHFNGVTLVVSKLFYIVQPDFTYFGQKDAQQARVIYQMIQDLSIPVTMRVMPIVRESDGLAMSSRNQYLDKKNRAMAPALHESLNEGANAILAGEKDPMQVLAVISEHLICFPEIEIDYVAVVDPVTFEEVSEIRKDVLIVAAIYLGTTRLIDNLFVNKPLK